jgi:signal transduction histidine kinase
VIGLALVVAVSTLAAGTVAVLALRLLPTLRLQLSGLALLAVVLPLGTVLLSGWVMFHMDADVKILAVTCASALASVGAALWLVRSLSRRVDDLQEASRRLAAGDLSTRIDETGPTELTAIARAVNAAAAELEHLFDARSQLVAWASHDLRTPLASMQAMLESLEDGLASPEQYLPAMSEQVRCLAMLVDDLFELSRIDAGLLTLELREAQPAAIVNACVHGLEAQAQAKGVRLEASIDDDVPEVRCLPEKVERVLYNLITNALRHTPSDGSVAVLVERLDDDVLVRVEDTGEGLPPDMRLTAAPFWRTHRDGANGSGLGLAIAQALVEAQGGRIWAENRPEGGARISFTLAAARPRTAEATV